MLSISDAQKLLDLSLCKGGKLIKPVCGVTIAGNMANMLEDIDAVGNNLVDTDGGLGSPTIRIKKMMVSGK